MPPNWRAASRARPRRRADTISPMAGERGDTGWLATSTTPQAGHCSCGSRNRQRGPAGKWTDAATAQGARLIGVYDSQIAFGQSRVLLVWTRLLMPNGRSIVLERQQGADAAGYSGLEDEVDNHWGELFKAAALSTFLAVGTELGAGSDTSSHDSAIIQALRHGASDSLNQTGQQVVRRSLNIQPTLIIRPGFPLRVIVNRDLVLEPYRG